jgi:hypothetical protein
MGPILAFHRSLLQCSSSSVVQDDGGARRSGVLYLFILARYITFMKMVTKPRVANVFSFITNVCIYTDLLPWGLPVHTLRVVRYSFVIRATIRFC